MLLVEVALQEIQYIHSQYIYEIIILLLTFPLSYIYLSFNDIINYKIKILHIHLIKYFLKMFLD